MDFYNEIDPYAADWLENLILAGHLPEGKVDRRSIRDITAGELEAWSRAHFFAGIGGWPLALHLAGWPATEPVWTGSCPCQSFSAAGQQDGLADDRNLWPAWFSQIKERRPHTIFGEQVGNAIGFGWLDGISADLEREGYTVGACLLGAHSVGAPHIRQRLYWVAYSEHSIRRTKLQKDGDSYRRDGFGRSGGISRLGESINERLERHAGHGDGGSQSGRIGSESAGSASQASGDGDWMEHADKPGGVRSTEGGSSEEEERREYDTGRVADASSERRQQIGGSPSGNEGQNEGRCQNGNHEPSGDGENFWSRYDLVPCSDGKARKFKPGIFPLADGVSGGVAVGSAIQESVAALSDEEKAHIVSRVGVLKGAGNAIVPQVAAEFIKAFMEIRND